MNDYILETENPTIGTSMELGGGHVWNYIFLYEER